jgi:hypothetical protein
MNIVRVPWIQCRADEATAELFPLMFRGREFQIMAYSEKEARDWWRGLPEADKGAALGLDAPADDSQSLF